MLGTFRTLTVHLDGVFGAGSSSGDTSTSANLTPDRLVVSSGNLSEARAVVSYDNNGGLSLDVSSYPSIAIWDASNDNTPTDWSVTLTSPGQSHTETISKAGTFGGNLDFALASFAGGGVDLSNVDSVTMTIDFDGYGGDATVHALALVPEPQEYALALGLIGLGFVAVRRFRK